jgi:hypothetical protein
VFTCTLFSWRPYVVIKQKVSFKMPDCPIKAAGLGNATSFTLPADPLKSGKLSAKGSAKVMDAVRC